jgi:transketolase
MGIKNTKALLRYSYKNNLSHIPSALSMHDYLWSIFKNKIVDQDDYIIIGKPFGAQSYYLIWQELGWLTEIECLGAGVKHDEVKFVKYSEETIGNALGIASGVALTTEKRIWVNLSDAALQMGNTLEAIQFIGHYQQKNIFVTIDNNDAQVLGKTSEIIGIDPVFNMFEGYGWDVKYVNGHNHEELNNCFTELEFTKPTVVICNTIKGGLVNEMVKDIKKWHYKKIENEEELELLFESIKNDK